MQKRENMISGKVYGTMDSSYNIDVSDNLLNKVSEYETSRLSSVINNIGKNFI